MGRVDERLRKLGLALPQPLKVPPGVVLPFPWVLVRGDRAFVSGHGPVEADGSLARPLGKVGAEVSVEEAVLLARKTGLAILRSLSDELGDLDRIAGWARVFGMVNAAPGFTDTPRVINGFSDLILEVFGPEAGRHARSAVGMAELPMRIAVEIEAEVILRA
jgi:enamine deaminase RidA (YjgF/YER057c/UK114 family)